MSLDRASLVTGRTVDEAGVRVPGATVAGFAVRGEQVETESLGTVETDAEGRYQLRARPADRHVVIAFARSRSAACAELVADAGKTTEAPQLELRRGVTISGRVTDDRGRPIPRTQVSVIPKSDGQTLYIAQRGVTWAPGNVTVAWSYAQCEDDGTYTMDGLAPGPHRVNPMLHAAAEDVGEGLAREVVAPAHGVDFVVSGAMLTLEFTSGGQPVAGAVCRLRSSAGDTMLHTDAEGRCTQRVLPHATYTARMEHAGHEASVHEFEAPGSGESFVEQIALVAAGARPTLIVRVNGPDGPVTSSAFALWRTEEFEEFPFGMAYESAGKAEDGRYALKGFKPGTYQLVVCPGGAWRSTAAYHLEIQRSIVLPLEGELELVVETAPAGRLRIAARGPDGQHVLVPCEVQDASGAKVRTTFMQRSATSATWNRNSLSPLGPSDVLPALAPGRYTVLLRSKEFTDRTITADVEAGKTTYLEIELQRR